MKNNIKGTLLIIGILVMLSGCRSNASDDNKKVNDNTEAVTNESETEKVIKNFKLTDLMGDVVIDNSIKREDSNVSLMNNMYEYKNGYITVCSKKNNTNNIRYYDKTSDTLAYMCNKPECVHVNNCISIIPTFSSESFAVGDGVMCYLQTDQDEEDDEVNQVNLYSVSLDTFEKTKISMIYEYNSKGTNIGGNSLNSIIHNGYCYCKGGIYVGDEEKAIIFRVKLEAGSKAELIYSENVSNSYPIIYKMYANSDKVYWGAGYQNNEVVYSFDEITGEVKKLKELNENQSNFAVHNDKIYDFDLNYGIYVYDSEFMNGKPLVENNINREGIVYTDDNYIYLLVANDSGDKNNPYYNKIIYIYDFNGKKLGESELSTRDKPISGLNIINGTILYEKSEYNIEKSYRMQYQYAVNVEDIIKGNKIYEDNIFTYEGSLIM